MIGRTARSLLGCVLLPLAACSSLRDDLPEDAPPLADMEEPLALHQEPDDEDERTALPLGGFTGVVVSEAPQRLESLDEACATVRIVRVVENSPADAAGLWEGDLLLSAWLDGGAPKAISYASQWRELELAANGGSTLYVRYDRGAVEREAAIDVLPRVRHTRRREVHRFREKDRVGVVVRTATEVEARAGGLGPGAGAVIVGLSAGSPWRSAGLRYGDLIVAANGAQINHPQVVLDLIREAEDDDEMVVTIVRDARSRELEVPLSRRQKELYELSIWPLFSYESDRGESEMSVLLGAVQQNTTNVAAEWRVLWLFTFASGDADRLEEAD